MIYPQLVGEPNFVLIGVSAVFGLLVIIIVYYIVTSKNKKFSQDKMMKNNTSTPTTLNGPNDNNGMYASAFPSTANLPTVYNNTPSPSLSNSKIKQVFNIKENIYTLDDAPGVCGALGAELASINQLIDSHKKGADWCNVGWTQDGLAAYPIQYSTWKTLQDNTPDKRNMCGKPGINLARNDPNLLYGVNCYGIKPEPKGNEKIKNVIVSDKQAALNAKIAQFQRNMNAIGVASFNTNNWSA
jgi:hypothetical protein